MTIRLQDKYPSQIDTSDPAMPYGKFKNVVAQGDGSGSPLEKEWPNDIYGALFALLDSAGITPNNVADKVGASQVLDAIQSLIDASSPTAVLRFETGTNNIVRWQRGKIAVNPTITFSGNDAIVTFAAPITSNIANVVIEATPENFGAVAFLSVRMPTTTTVRVSRWNGDTGAPINMSIADSVTHLTVWSDIP